jgi:hypothetical protein
MARARIVMMGLHRGNPGAFMPTMTPTAQGASNGVNMVFGAPGNASVPAPRPASVAQFAGRQGLVQPSACAPTVIRPSIYVAGICGGVPPVPVRPRIVSPTPAIAPVYSARTKMRKPSRIGGQTVTRNVRPVIAWPQYGGGFA